MPKKIFNFPRADSASSAREFHPDLAARRGSCGESTLPIAIRSKMEDHVGHKGELAPAHPVIVRIRVVGVIAIAEVHRILRLNVQSH